MQVQLTHLFLAGAAALGAANGVRVAFKNPAYAGRRATACVPRALRGIAEVAVFVVLVAVIGCVMPVMWAADTIEAILNIPPMSPSGRVVWSFQFNRDD